MQEVADVVAPWLTEMMRIRPAPIPPHLPDQPYMFSQYDSFTRNTLCDGAREDAAEIAAEVEVAVVAVARAALLPDHEERRARPVFPAQHVGRAERAVVEVGVVRVRVRRVAVGVVRRAAVHELLVAGVLAGRHERLGVASGSTGSA